LDAAQLHAVLAASAEALANLLELVPESHRARLLELPLLVTHPNVALAARELGFGRAAAVPGGEAGLVQALLDAFGGRH
jgi:uroporphyrinogen-III synthase